MQKTTRSTRHMSTNIEGLLRNMKGKKINFLEDDNGNPLSDKEARKQIAELQAKGHKLIPSGDCEGFDPFGGGCPSHDSQVLYQITEIEWDLLNEQTELMVNEDLNFSDIAYFNFQKSVIETIDHKEIGFDCLNEKTFLDVVGIFA